MNHTTRTILKNKTQDKVMVLSLSCLNWMPYVSINLVFHLYFLHLKFYFIVVRIFNMRSTLLTISEEHILLLLK